MNLNSARDYLTEQFNENGDSGWLEGWICGYTDPDHNNSKASDIYEALFDHLQKLRNQLKSGKQYNINKRFENNGRVYPFDKLELNDWFVVRCESKVEQARIANSISATACQWGKKNDKKFSIKRSPNNEITCTRIL